MPQYRIVKRDITTNGKLTTEYEVQRLFLFWWIGIKMFCVTRHGSAWGTLRAFHITDSLEFARKYIKLYSKYPMRIRYKGCILSLGLTSQGEVVWFSNKKSKRSGGYFTFYPFSHNIEYLKRLIDEEKPTVKVNKTIIE